MLPTHAESQCLVGGADSGPRSSWPGGRRLLMVVGVVGACACAAAAATGAFYAHRGPVATPDLDGGIALFTATEWIARGDEGGTEIDGVTYSPKDCYREAIAAEPDNGKAWIRWGMKGGGVILGITYDAKACYRKALVLTEYTDPEAWMYFGDEGGDRIGEVMYDKVACYTKALVIDVNMAAAWQRLGFAGGNHFDGKMHSPVDCFERALDLDPGLADSWAELGRLGGGKWGAKSCFVRALELNKQGGWAWLGFGRIGGGEFDQIEFTPAQCFVKALHAFKEEEPEDAKGVCNAWTEIGFAGGASYGDKLYTPKQAFVEGLKASKDVALTWYGMGLAGGSPEIDGDNFDTPKECFAMAKQLAPENPEVDAELGWALDPADNPERLNLFESALKGHAKLARAWHGVADVLKGGGTFDFQGHSYTSLDCYKQAVLSDPNYWQAWVELSKVPPPLTVGTETVTALQCCINAVEAQPDAADAWCELALHMESTVTVGTETYDAAEVQNKCAAQGPLVDGLGPFRYDGLFNWW